MTHEVDEIALARGAQIDQVELVNTRFLTHKALCLSLVLWGVGGCGDQASPDELEPGSGSRDAGTSSAPDAGTSGALTADQALDRYYPHPPGARWIYRHLGGTRWDETVTMEETEFDGQPAILMKDTPGPSGTRSESVLTRQGGGLFRVHKDTLLGQTPEERVDYDPGFVRFHGTWVVEGMGYSGSLDYERVEYDAQGQLLRDGSREHTYTVVAVDQQVSVLAGTFEDCIVVRRERVRGVDDPLEEGDDKEYTFCAGVGKVLEITASEGKREELLECEIPGGACP